MSIFAGRKVVVTGGGGFLGGVLVNKLIDVGANVYVVDIDPKNINPLAHNSIVNAGSPDALARSFDGAFAVFNLAALVAGVLYNQRNHLEMYYENERLQVAPVIAAERAGVEHLLQVSSVCAYAPEHNNPAIEANGWEGEPAAANNGYSWAKRMGERAALWSSIPRPVIVRPSNLYGPGDDFSDRCHVIPAIIKKTLFDDVVRLNGTGNEEREFLFVDDAAAGCLAALEKGTAREAYNLAGPTSLSIHMLADTIRRLSGQDKLIEFAARADAGDSARWSSNAKASAALGWTAQTTLLDGLAKTIAWYRGRRHAE